MSAVTQAPPRGVSRPVMPAVSARITAAVAVMVALIGGFVGSSGRLSLTPSGGPRVASGTLQMLVDQEWVPVSVGQRLAPGTSLRVPDEAVTLDVRGGAVDLAASTRATVGMPFVVTAGTAVVRSDQVRVGNAVVTGRGNGAWRYDATGRIGTYSGTTVLSDAAGREISVPTLQEAQLRDGVVDGTVHPYVAVRTDPFDRQYLVDAFAVDDLVDALKRGLAIDYGMAPQSAEFYTDFVGLDAALFAELDDVAFERDGARIGPPADVLVAGVVTDGLVVDGGLPPQVAAARVRTQRLQGATWGLIAQAAGLDASDVRAAADRALTRRQTRVDQGDAVAVVVPSPPAPIEPVPTPPPPAPSTPPVPPPAPAPPDAGDGGGAPHAPEPGVVGGVVQSLGADTLVGGETGELVDDVARVLDDVLDGPERGSGAPPGPDGHGLLDTVGATLQGATDSVEGLLATLLGGGTHLHDVPRRTTVRR